MFVFTAEAGAKSAESLNLRASRAATEARELVSEADRPQRHTK
jgi:hypothetical protein